jgi:hypothetical protein
MFPDVKQFVYSAPGILLLCVKHANPEADAKCPYVREASFAFWPQRVLASAADESDGCVVDHLLRLNRKS